MIFIITILVLILAYLSGSVNYAIIVTRMVFFPGGTCWEFFLVAAVGIAAITGHCKPVFFQFCLSR